MLDQTAFTGKTHPATAITAPRETVKVCPEDLELLDVLVRLHGVAGLADLLGRARQTVTSWRAGRHRIPGTVRRRLGRILAEDAAAGARLP